MDSIFYSNEDLLDTEMYIFAGACKGDVNGAESWCQHNARGKSWVRVDLGLADDTPSGKWANPCETRVIRSINIFYSDSPAMFFYASEG